MVEKWQPLERIVCPACGQAVLFQTDYFCVTCGAHNDELYRAEHDAPEYAATMSRYQIEREYARAGMPFRHDPTYETTASALLQSMVMQEARYRKEESNA